MASEVDDIIPSLIVEKVIPGKQLGNMLRKYLQTPYYIIF